MMSPLRKIRHFRNLSIEDVVKSIGSDSGNISRIENGKQIPQKEFLTKLIAYFSPHITVEHIIYPEKFKDWTPK